jgi:hypothetical protein
MTLSEFFMTFGAYFYEGWRLIKKLAIRQAQNTQNPGFPRACQTQIYAGQDAFIF